MQTTVVGGVHAVSKRVKLGDDVAIGIVSKALERQPAVLFRKKTLLALDDALRHRAKRKALQIRPVVVDTNAVEHTTRAVDLAAFRRKLEHPLRRVGDERRLFETLIAGDVAAVGTHVAQV